MRRKKNKKGIYVNTRGELVTFADKGVKGQELTPPKTGEVYVVFDEEQYRRNWNEEIGTGPEMWETITDIKNHDPKLDGYINTRIMSVISLPREVTGDGPESDFVREVMSKWKQFHSVLYEILDCAFCAGYAVPETMWDEIDMGGIKWVIDAIKPRNPGQFVFDKDNKLRMVTPNEADGILIDEVKFPVLTFRKFHENRYGRSVMEGVYWYHYIKRKTVEMCAIYTGRHAIPQPIISGDMKDETADKLEAFLNDLKNATGIVIPQEIDIDLLQSNNTNAVKVFEYIIDYIDRCMAVSILGQTLTSDTGETGSYAQAKVHSDVKGEITDSDIDMLENYFNDQIIEPMVRINFPNVETMPKWKIIRKDYVDIKMMAEVIVMLMQNGFQPLKSWVYEIIGAPIPAEGDEVLEGVVSAGTTPGDGQKTEFADSNTVAHAVYLREMEDKIMQGAG